MSGFVVVDQTTDDRVVIWQVSVGDGLESAMAGAWVLAGEDVRIDGLLGDHIRVTTAASAARFGQGAALSELASSIDREIKALDAAFKTHVASLPSSRRSLVRPRWPEVVHSPRDEVAGDPVCSTALSQARWGSDLLTAWAKVERERLLRPFLIPNGGNVPREYPPGWPTVIRTNGGQA